MLPREELKRLCEELFFFNLAHQHELTKRSAAEKAKDDDNYEEVKCIKEENLNFDALKMVKSHLFDKYTLNNCVTYCLKHWPDYDYVLISYADDIWSPDDFACMCAHKEAFRDNVRLQEYQCSNMCPESHEKYR